MFDAPIYVLRPGTLHHDSASQQLSSAFAKLQVVASSAILADTLADVKSILKKSPHTSNTVMVASIADSTDDSITTKNKL